MSEYPTAVFRRGLQLLTYFVFATLLCPPAWAWFGPQNHPHVLRVGSWHGIPGNYSTIQSAVDAAQPGDWILIGPGDYHERGDRVHPTGDVASGGVYVTTPGLHIRGMDRNGVVVDGTRPGAPQCSSAPADQDFGAAQRRQSAARAQWRVGLQGRQRHGGEPDRVQLPRRRRRRRQ